MRVQDQVALVTGGGRGLGEAICMTLAREGAHISVSDIHLPDAERVAESIKRLGRRAVALKADVSREQDVRTMVKQTVEALGTVDILVNNAGIIYQGPVADMSEEAWNKVLDVNLKSAFLCSREVMPILKQKRSGKIISLGSLAGKVGGLAVGANYAASKAGVICLTKSLAKELAPFGVNVNCLAPGVVETDMTKTLPKEDLRKSIPLGRLGEVQDVANAVLFFASEESKYITGETLNVNGGILMD